MTDLVTVVQFVAGVLAVATGLLVSGRLVASLRRGNATLSVTTGTVTLLALCAIVIGGAVLTATVGDRGVDGHVMASLAIVLGTLAVVQQRIDRRPSSE